MFLKTGITTANRIKNAPINSLMPSCSEKNVNARTPATRGSKMYIIAILWGLILVCAHEFKPHASDPAISPRYKRGIHDTRFTGVFSPP